MAYAEQNISVYGTEEQFFYSLKTFLTENTVAQFTTVSDYDATTRAVSFAINGLTLKFTGQGSGSSPASTVRTEIILGNTTLVSKVVPFTSTNVIAGTTLTERTLKLLLIRKGSSIVLNVGSRIEVIGKGAVALAVIPSENNYVYGTSGNGTSWSFIQNDNQAGCILSPYHTYPKATGQLFLDPELPILNSANGEFLFSTTGIIGLGGAESQHFYTGINGDRYYAIMPNVAIKLEE